MLQLVAYICNAHWQKLGQRLLRVGIGNTFDELMDSANSVGPNIATRVIVHHIQHHVIQRFGKVYADLAERSTNSVNEVH